MRKRKRDKKAVSFFGELERQISPATTGITESDAFDIYYWQKAPKQVGKSIIRLTDDAAKANAKKIYDAWGWWDDDEDQVYGVFRSLKDKVQVSQVAYWYYKAHEINLIDDIRSRMSQSEVAKVMEIVGPKQQYRIA
ncbi:MAG: hypothetical protein H6585_10160 [Flavobacteriales bacterium]|nr:hypothetical protein [Flavobacteriales bacterium]